MTDSQPSALQTTKERAAAWVKLTDDEKHHSIVGRFTSELFIGTEIPKLLSALESVQQVTEEAVEVWKDQIGTHYNGCHVRHVACLALMVQRLIDRGLEVQE